MRQYATPLFTASCLLCVCRDIVGFRAPYLSTDENVRKVLAANKFLYDRCASTDSSINE